jgi:nucleoside-diphosphate-sugar epimerase
LPIALLRTPFLILHVLSCRDERVSILVTGASGFVGRATLGALAERDAEVHVLSRRRPDTPADHVWHDVDLLDTRAVRDFVNRIRPRTILHLAWYVEPGSFWTAPQNLDWIAASLQLARTAAEAGATRFVGVGTCYEYAFPAEGNCDEGSTPIEPTTLYGVSKDATRRVLEEFAAATGISFAWARLFYLYGPGEAPSRLVASVARALAAGEAARCASGRPVRDFMDVRDAGDAIAALALSGVTGAVNVATGDGYSIADAVGRLAALAGRADLLQLGALADRPGEPRRIVAEVRRLRNEVGFQPAHTLDEGLLHALQYWVRKREYPES